MIGIVEYCQQLFLRGRVKKLFLVMCVVLLAACASPSRLVYSSGFSFNNYDYVVVSKPDGQVTSTSLYGMDIEIGNMLSRYNMNVVGDKELETLSDENKARTLFVRMALSASNNRILVSLSFDDVVTGRTGSSITGVSKGDIFDAGDREEAFESASRTVIKAIVRDKGLTVEDEKQKMPWD